MKALYAIVISLYFLKQFFEYAYAIDVYPVISGMLLLIIVLNFVRLFSSKDVLVYISVIVFSFFSTLLIAQSVNDNYLNSIFIYFLQPLAIFSIFIGKNKNSTKEISRFILIVLSLSSIPLFLGCIYFYLVHLVGFPDPFEIYEIEFTSLQGGGNYITLRNTSFMGSSLILCGVALIQFLASKYLSMNSEIRIFSLCVFCALMSIAFSLSRRGILPVMLFYFLILFWDSGSKVIKFILFTLGAFMITFIVSPELLEILFLRTISIFDFVNDSSNISRIELMGKGIFDILRQPWGLGFGSLSSIGYSVEQVREIASVRVTESSIISFIGELGVPAAAILFGLMFSKIKRLNRRVIGLFFMPLLVESIVGLGIYGPAVSFLTISFLCAVYFHETQSRFKYNKYS